MGDVQSFDEQGPVAGESFGPETRKKYTNFCSKCHKMFESYYQVKPGDEAFCEKCSRDTDGEADISGVYTISER